MSNVPQAVSNKNGLALKKKQTKTPPLQTDDVMPKLHV